MWVVPEVKQTTSSFQTVMKYSAICVLVTLAILFIRKNGLDVGGSISDYQCNEVGRFPDPTNIRNCYRSYVLCIADDHWKSYSCPLGTRFSALDGCVSDTESEVECLSASGDSAMIELFSDRITASFECQSVGVFRNSHTATCADYILCVNTMQSELYAIYLHCEENQFFSEEHSACVDAEKNYCDPDGVLHLINQPPPPPRPLPAATPSPLEQTTRVHYQTDESATVPTTILITTTNTSPQVEEYKAQTKLPHSHGCKEDDEEQNISDSDEVELIVTSPHLPQAVPSSLFRCPWAGRFPNPFGKTPMDYILCTSIYQSKEIQGYFFQCPVITIFSVAMGRCVRENLDLVLLLTEVITESSETTITTERVNTETTSMDSTTEGITVPTMLFQEDTESVAIDTTTTESVESTTTGITTESPTTPKTTTIVPSVLTNALQCTETGRFHTEFTLDCRSYLLCSPDISGNLLGTYFNCPEDTKFSDVLGRCVRDYDCPYYHCTQPGTYPYVRDTDRYVMCLRSRNRGFVGYRMECPKDTIFSQILRRCIPKRYRDLRVWK